MNEIFIEKIGIILNGEYKDWYLKIVPTVPNADDFLVLISKAKNFKGEGYDDWVESKEKLPQYFQESKWVIKWLDEREDDNSEITGS